MIEDKLHFLGHASFRLDGPPVIYFDPWKLTGQPPQADVVLVSHDHHDHCSPDDVRKVSGPNTVVVSNPSAASKLGRHVRVLRVGEVATLGEVRIEAVAAYNVGKRFHPKEAGHNGYLVTLGGERLYFAGDTDLTEEMRAVQCDVALLPVSGTYVMTASEAARAAEALQPRLAIPMHYGAGVAGTLEDAERFKALSSVPVKILVASAT